jgi:hypothetical protein
MKRKALQLGKLYASKSAEKQRGYPISPVEAYDGQTEELLAAIESLKTMLKDVRSPSEPAAFDYGSGRVVQCEEPHRVTTIFDSGPLKPRSFLEVLGQRKTGDSEITPTTERNATTTGASSKLARKGTASAFQYDGEKGASIKTPVGFLRDAARRRERGKELEADERADCIFDSSAAATRPSSLRNNEVAKSARTAAAALFTGDGPRVLANVESLQRRPEYREATLLLSRRPETPGMPVSQKERAMVMVCNSLKDFFNTSLNGKGTRTSDNNNAVEVALAAVSSSAMFDQDLGRAVGRLLGLHHRTLKRGIESRSLLDISKTWLRVTRQQYRNHLGGEAMGIISDWLHSDEASRVDNSRKGEVLIPLEVNAGNVVQYATHFPRTYSGTWTELLRRFRLSHCWKQVQAAWNGKNGGNNYTRKNKTVVFEKKVRSHPHHRTSYYCAHSIDIIGGIKTNTD